MNKKDDWTNRRPCILGGVICPGRLHKFGVIIDDNKVPGDVASVVSKCKESNYIHNHVMMLLWGIF